MIQLVSVALNMGLGGVKRQWKRGLGASLAALLTMGGQTVGAAVTYTIQDLGMGWQPTGINDNGLIVGNILSGVQSEVALWQGGCVGNCLQNIGTLGRSYAYATSINNAGAITGFTQIGSSLNEAFIYQNGFRADLGTLGGNQSQGYAINDFGQVAGSSNASLGYDSAFFYGAGNMQDIGTGTATVGVPAWLGQNNFLTPSFASSINNQGQVVGNTHLLGGSGYMSAFVYDPNSSNPYTIISPLASPSAGSRYLYDPTARIFAVDINDAGQVVGRTYDDALGGNRGFIFQNGTFSDLDASVNVPFAINNSGQILGYNNVGPTVGMVLVDNGNVLSWTDLIGQNTSWSLSTGTGNMSLNNAGQIVGIGYLGGEQHAFLMTPNVPNPVDAAAPTNLELAKMSLGTYNSDNQIIGKIGAFSPIVGGSIGIKPSGYLDIKGGQNPGTYVYAESYIAVGQNGGRDQIIIAIRGSSSREDYELRNGSFIGLGASDEYKAGAKEIAGLIAELRKTNPDADFTLTGHSMGGALAHSVADALGIDALGFDAPGANTLLDGIASELVTIARSNLSTDVFSLTRDIKNIRFYGDEVSKIGSLYNGIYPDLVTITPRDSSKRDAIDQLAGLCAYHCHQLQKIVDALQDPTEFTTEPDISDQAQQSLLPLAGILNAAKIAKAFDLGVTPGRIYGLDPDGVGDFIELSMLNSDVNLSSFLLPAFDADFPIWALYNSEWTNIGLAHGYSEFVVSPASVYRIGNPRPLQDETGRFAIGLRFASAGTFRGSIGLVSTSVPEPDTWVMLVVGFGILGSMFRRRAKSETLFLRKMLSV